mmetsp:Transcript_41496/g.87034  ORF Transcript_41496/g.87034 Transcript_41496/m.87034 type:complete len:281 (-) Transcript_41496:924-1766(-)
MVSAMTNRIPWGDDDDDDDEEAEDDGRSRERLQDTKSSRGGMVTSAEGFWDMIFEKERLESDTECMVSTSDVVISLLLLLLFSSFDALPSVDGPGMGKAVGVVSLASDTRSPPSSSSFGVLDRVISKMCFSSNSNVRTNPSSASSSNFRRFSGFSPSVADDGGMLLEDRILTPPSSSMSSRYPSYISHDAFHSAAFSSISAISTSTPRATTEIYSAFSSASSSLPPSSFPALLPIMPPSSLLLAVAAALPLFDPTTATPRQSKGLRPPLALTSFTARLVA